MAMELKNISQKVISIGSIAVLPDDVIDISEQQAEQPSIKAFIKLGYVSVSKKSCAASTEKQTREISPADITDSADTPTSDETAADTNASADVETEKGSTGRRGKSK